MKICILLSSIEEKAKFSPLSNFLIDPTPHLSKHQSEIHSIKKATAYTQLRDLTKRPFDVFLNLCDGSLDDNLPGLDVVQILEHFQVPFTGADSFFKSVTREAVKARCPSLGIKTPASIFVDAPLDIDLAVTSLHFPLLVKPAEGHDSFGLTRDSRVETREQLQTQVCRMLNTYGRALIEEFIEGQEWTVLVAENPNDVTNPVAYLPIGISFPEGETFQHFDLKWNSWNTLIPHPCANPALTQELQESAKNLFRGLAGTGYARCDFRVNPAGEIFLLEINANCSVFYVQGSEGNADSILHFDPAGHAGFVETILASALARHRRASKYDRHKE